MGHASRIFPDRKPRDAEDWSLRMAQRALSALLEGSRRPTSIRIADLRSSAISAMSALSVDDRGLIAAWLGLQLLNASASEQAHVLASLTRIDGPLTIAVREKRSLALARFGQAASQPERVLGCSRSA
ncbi:hypothetical protein [Dokdonella sp.]|uniref:hypothetical protein n=1 Tax=Dokdonella sp. TaxID=2291710 RepID=UPI003528D025